MPMITIRYVEPEIGGPDRRPAIAKAAAAWAAEYLGKDKGVTAVLVEPADPGGWCIGGQRPTDAGLAAFWLDIKITAGTNLKGETTRFVQAAFTGMADLLGPLHPESYVLVHAVDGHAYGYGGSTQEQRWAASQVNTSA
ncbi:4-oxalocrotonate tautomerase [Niveispirillum sp. BGYR6]|uniref:4-oxalocrotonate tautomerase n=1 Tax=Niveispirillum sp. BGYR6 TaxID=2971249 RepID=UPI0022B98B6D|nr:4-oxalocrotonate tautomerase [Niveispirillum sp. BGYR6]MDG5494210.1 4-oxalocrotonate tautomerase [Niveispirillum sp. BGYR6]